VLRGERRPSDRPLDESSLVTLAVLTGLSLRSRPISLLATTTACVLLDSGERILGKLGVLTSSNREERLAELALNRHIDAILILTITG